MRINLTYNGLLDYLSKPYTMQDAQYKTNHRWDMSQGSKSGPPSEDQTHYLLSDPQDLLANH